MTGPPPAATSRSAAAFAAVATLALLAFGFATLWVPERWASAVVQIGFLLSFAVLLWMRVLRPFPFRIPHAALPLAAIVLWAGLQLLLGLSIQPFATRESLLEFAAHLAALLLFYQASSSPAWRPRFLRFWLWGGAIISAQALLQVLSGTGQAFWIFDTGYDQGVLGAFVYRNKFAQFVLLVLPIAVLHAVRPGRRAALALPAAAIMFSAVVASGSRSGFTLLLIELAAVLILCWRRGLISSLRLAALTAASSALFALFAYLAGWELLFGRLFGLDPLADHRWDIIQSSLSAARDHLWTGSGLGTWPLLYPRYALFDAGVFVNQAHCDWLQWICDGGLPMLALMLWLFASFLPGALRSIWGIGLLFVLLHAFVDYPFHQLPVFATFILLTAQLASGEARPTGLPPSVILDTPLESSAQ